MINTEECDEPAKNAQEQTQSAQSEHDLHKVISELKKSHLDEINDLRNQLDDLRTRATIIETTKQDELDEIRYRNKQETDSLNHIINALQSDLNTIRRENDKLSSNFKEYRKQVHLANSSEMKSPVANSSNLTSRLNLSPFGSTKTDHSASTLNTNNNNNNISQENENLEEDMRKAKESAEMLRSVVLPLETEISSLRSRSSTSDKRIKELEKIIEEERMEKLRIIDQEQKLIDESFTGPIEADLEAFRTNNKNNSEIDNIYFKKFIQLKKYLKNNENKFIDLEQANLRAVKQLFSILTHEQKLRLIPNRPKSKSVISGVSSKSEHLETILDEKNPDDHDDDSFVLEQNETISKIEQLIDQLTNNNTNIEHDIQSISRTIDTQSLLSMQSDASTNLNQAHQVFSYVELMAMYEMERNNLLKFKEMESNFHQQAKESSKKIEDLNGEMTSLSSLIEEMRKQYMLLQGQYKHQMESLIKLNEDIRNEIKITELKNEQFKQDNLKLKAENKQFYGDQTILVKEIDEQYPACSNLEEIQRQNAAIKQEMGKLVMANQALNKQHALSLETIKHLQKVNMQYQRSNSMQDHLVIAQSLESELQRERKVRVEAETDIQEYKSQLLLIKERGQTLVESLKQRNEQNEFEIRKLKEDNQEFQNQIQSLKKDAKNSLSVQEDLVRLIQSLQIELNQTKGSSNDGQMRQGPLEVRCQHEDDFNECSECKSVFSVTRRKHRCKHCCKIFCADCCAKTVLSGPNLRPHKVCCSCHTLLDKDNSNGKT